MHKKNLTKAKPVTDAKYFAQARLLMQNCDKNGQRPTYIYPQPTQSPISHDSNKFDVGAATGDLAISPSKMVP